VIGRLLAIALLLALNGFFVAAEFALVRARRTKLEAMARGGDRKARLAMRALGDLRRMLAAGLLGITLSSIGLGYLAQSALADAMADALVALPFLEFSLRVAVAATVAFITLAYLHVVVGELAPRAIGVSHPEHVARWLAPPLLAFAWIMTPFIALANHSARGLLRLLGQRHPLDEDAVHSPEELRLLVEQSQEGGALEQQDADLIEGVFEFSEKTAREVMTPRTEIVALPVEATLEDTMRVIAEGGFSRYPVYEDSIDNIIGLFLAKDLIPVLHAPAHAFSLRALVREVHVVPGSREVEDVLADFKRLKEHLAVILDEYGGTAGIVTMEDLLEEIVGEILDEYDEPEESGATGGSGVVLTPGTMHIADLNERFGLDVPEGEYSTIGGFVFGTLGRLPALGDRVAAGGAVFTVHRMDGRRIDTLAVDLKTLGDRRERERS
jgi:CBS domain containing-hemolysin-like protein